MQLKTVYSFLGLFLVLSACSGLQGADDRGPDRWRDGRPITEDLNNLETLSFGDILSQCREKKNTGMCPPMNDIDLVFTALPRSWQGLNVTGTVRCCLHSQLRATQKQICDTRNELERQRMEAEGSGSESTLISIENSIDRLDELHSNFNNDLYEYANRVDTDRGNFLGEEQRALRDILNTESYNTCDGYYRDADQYRYPNDYSRDRRNRRRYYE